MKSRSQDKTNHEFGRLLYREEEKKAIVERKFEDDNNAFLLTDAVDELELQAFELGGGGGGAVPHPQAHGNGYPSPRPPMSAPPVPAGAPPPPGYPPGAGYDDDDQVCMCVFCIVMDCLVNYGTYMYVMWCFV